MKAGGTLTVAAVAMCLAATGPFEASAQGPTAPTPEIAVIEDVLFSDNAEGGHGNWDRWDADGNGVPALEYWGATNHQVINGNQSFYSSRCNRVGGVETCNNGLGHVYAGQMNAIMRLTDAQAVDLSGYDHGVLQFNYVVNDQDPDETDDYLTIYSNQGGLFGAPVIPSGVIPAVGAMGWSIGNTATKVGFIFTSNADAERGHGAFVDDIVVSGAQEVDEGETYEAGDPEIVFDGTGSEPVSDSAPIVSYDWSFGDGGFGSGPVVEHVYAGLGVYRVELTVTDAAMDSSTTHGFIHVIPEPATLGLLALGGLALLRRRRR